MPDDRISCGNPAGIHIPDNLEIQQLSKTNEETSWDRENSQQEI
jgi:hypothetical protein